MARSTSRAPSPDRPRPRHTTLSSSPGKLCHCPVGGRTPHHVSSAQCLLATYYRQGVGRALWAQRQEARPRPQRAHSLVAETLSQGTK